MREIRFRAWDEELQVMSNPFTLGDLQNHEDFTFNTPDGEACCGYNEFGLDNPKHILEQYTGLKDKNGLIEIFEGDIVIAGNRGTGVVEWYAGGFITRFDARRYELINNHVEVIGNIHENKELLHGND